MLSASYLYAQADLCGQGFVYADDAIWNPVDGAEGIESESTLFINDKKVNNHGLGSKHEYSSRCLKSGSIVNPAAIVVSLLGVFWLVRKSVNKIGLYR